MNRSILLAAVCASALVAAPGAFAKTLIFCSEGSPENFYPAVNTTGTSFDASEPVYNRIVEFERGGTKVVPGLDVSKAAHRVLEAPGLHPSFGMQQCQFRVVFPAVRRDTTWKR